MEETNDSGLGTRVKWRFVLAVIGICLILVYDSVVLALGIGLVSPALFAQSYILMEILVNSGIVLVGLGFHALYLLYGRVQCRIAFFGFVLSPVFLLMRMLPVFLAYGAWIYLASNLVIPLLGALAFFSLRSERGALFVLTSIIVALGALMDWLSFALSGGILLILSPELGMTIRSVGRILMWIFVGAAFAWAYKNRPSGQSFAGGLEPES